MATRDTDIKLLFVYGTLKDATAPTFVREATVKGLTLYAVTQYYPGAVKDENGEVHGELHLLGEGDLAYYDRYEGVPYLYIRERITTTDGAEAWVYIWNQGLDGIEHIGPTWEREGSVAWN